MSKKSSLAKNTIILAVGKFSSQLITFLMLPLYTAFLAPSDYGVVDLVVTYVALFAPTVTLQMEMAVFRFLIDARQSETEKKRVISNALQIAIAMTLILIAGFVTVGQFINIPYMWLVLAIIVMAVFSGFCLQVARGLGKNTNFAIASVITGVTTVVSNVYLIVFLGMGAAGLLTSMLLASALNVIYLVLSLKLYRYISLNNSDKNLKKELLKYSVPLVPNGISWWVINAADRTIISIVLGLTSNGIYAIASKFPLVFSAVFGVFGMSWTESASMHIGSKDRDKFFSDTFDTALRFFGALGLGIIATLPFVFPLLVHESYKEAYIYIPLMILGALFNAVVGLYSAVYVAKKMTKQVANTSITAAIISISINLILIQFIGLFAAALANAIAFLSMAIYRHFDLRRYVAISYKKSLFAIFTILYSIVIASYYINNLYLSIAMLGFVVLLAWWLNRGVVRFVWEKIAGRLRRGVNNPI